jgi:NAD(P)-dependent dehydrogenase (short-subunit alcohol dehydrogenase family)
VPTALITGANRGLGFEISRQLGERGYEIVLGCREPAKGEQARARLAEDGIAADVLVIDVGNPDSIAAACKNFSASHDRLDVLVNNAGILNDFGQRASELATDRLRECFETNFFGAFETTKQFLPLIRKSNSGRIVNMSSDLGSLQSMGDPESAQYGVFAAGYQASKCALNVLTILFAKELADTGIKVNSASPGLSRTDMGGPDAPLSVEQGAATAVWLATLDDDGPSGEFFSASLNGARHPW